MPKEQKTAIIYNLARLRDLPPRELSIHELELLQKYGDGLKRIFERMTDAPQNTQEEESSSLLLGGSLCCLPNGEVQFTSSMGEQDVVLPVSADVLAMIDVAAIASSDDIVAEVRCENRIPKEVQALLRF